MKLAAGRTEMRASLFSMWTELQRQTETWWSSCLLDVNGLTINEASVKFSAACLETWKGAALSKTWKKGGLRVKVKGGRWRKEEWKEKWRWKSRENRGENRRKKNKRRKMTSVGVCSSAGNASHLDMFKCTAGQGSQTITPKKPVQSHTHTHPGWFLHF